MKISTLSPRPPPLNSSLPLKPPVAITLAMITPPRMARAKNPRRRLKKRKMTTRKSTTAVWRPKTSSSS